MKKVVLEAVEGSKFANINPVAVLIAGNNQVIVENWLKLSDNPFKIGIVVDRKFKLKKNACLSLNVITEVFFNEISRKNMVFMSADFASYRILVGAVVSFLGNVSRKVIINDKNFVVVDIEKVVVNTDYLDENFNFEFSNKPAVLFKISNKKYGFLETFKEVK